MCSSDLAIKLIVATMANAVLEGKQGVQMGDVPENLLEQDSDAAEAKEEVAEATDELI